MRKTLFVALAVGAVLFTTATQASALASDLPAPTPTKPIAGAATGKPLPLPTLTNIRTGRHDRYDRTVFDFTGGTPAYRVQYDVLRPQAAEGVIAVNGAATLVVVFEGVSVTKAPGTRNPELPTLRQIKFGGAFEGYASFGLGLRDRVGFRVFVLHGPDRVVVDVAHQPAQGFQTAAFTNSGPAAEVLVEKVRFGHHPGYDRVVFDLKGADLPTLRVAYVGSTLRLTFTGRGSATLSPHASYAGPGRYQFGTTSVAFTIVGAGIMTADVNTGHRTGFRVLLLHNNTRVAVDLKK
jgi:hypothetical protein